MHIDSYTHARAALDTLTCITHILVCADGKDWNRCAAFAEQLASPRVENALNAQLKGYACTEVLECCAKVKEPAWWRRCIHTLYIQKDNVDWQDHTNIHLMHSTYKNNHIHTYLLTLRRAGQAWRAG